MSDDDTIQEVADILSKRINYEAINRLVTLITHGEPLSDQEHALMRIRVIQMLYETYQVCSAYRALWRKADEP